MKIKRVDNKHMAIHTKAKAKIRIKNNSGIRKKTERAYTIQGNVTGRKTGAGNKIETDKVTDKRNLLQDKKLAGMAGKNRQAVTGKGIQAGQTVKGAATEKLWKETDSREETRDSTIQEMEKYARYRTIKAKRWKGSIKKPAALKIAGAAVSQTAMKQMEGGEEIRNSCMTAAVLSIPTVNAAKAGKRLFQTETVKAKEQKIRQVQAGSRVKKRETTDYIKTAKDKTAKTFVIENKYNAEAQTVQQTDTRANTQREEKKTEEPAKGKRSQTIRKKPAAEVRTVSVVNMAGHIQTVKKQKEKQKQVQIGSQIKQKETLNNIKMAYKTVPEAGYRTENAGVQKAVVKIISQKTVDAHIASSFLETDTQKLADRHGKKAMIQSMYKTGDIKAKLPVNEMVLKEDGSNSKEPSKSIDLKNHKKQKQFSLNKVIHTTGNYVMNKEKTDEKPIDKEQKKQPDHIKIKKVSVKEKIKKDKKRNKTRKVQTAISTEYGRDRERNRKEYHTRDKGERKENIKKRMVQIVVDRLRQEENKENAGKILKDVVKVRFFILVKQIVRYVGLFFLAVSVMVAMVLLPVILVIAVLYNSPFAIFFPSISSGDTTQDVLSAYVEEFNQEVDREVSDCAGYNSSQKIYVNSGGIQITDNYYDILAVYMVKHGIGDTATDMTDQAKQKLEAVFDDMCSYYVTSSTVPVRNADGTVTVSTAKYVNIVLKNWQDMVPVYNFNDKEQELLAEIMKPEYLALLGYGENVGNGNQRPGILPEQYQAVLDTVSDENGRKVLEFAFSKVGYPYSQALRDSGTYFDCSSLAYYAWRNAGVTIMYHGANTAAAEGQYCYDNNLLVHYDEMQPGDLIFYSYQSNGRFMDISHVAIYAGNGMVVEAANTNLGVVYRPVQGRDSIVFIGRPR